MSERPGDWELLGHGSDPVPGSPDEIGVEATHYQGVAQDIADQVLRLRAIATTGGQAALQGEYADALAECADELAQDLDKAHHRFAVVGSQLSSWQPSLQQARDQTGQQLLRAEDAEAQRFANQPQPGDHGDELTPEQQSAVDVRRTRREAAESDLAAIRSEHERTMTALDEDAAAVSRAIRDAADDDLKDGFWDGVKDWVHRHAAVLTFIADICSWVVTVVAVIALFCTPVGWVIALAIVAGVAALALHSALAWSGDGSWVDVAFDAIGLLTLGAGKVATQGAKAGRMLSLARAGRVEGAAARATVAATARTELAAARGPVARAVTWLVRSNKVAVTARGSSAYVRAFAGTMRTVLPETTALERLAVGGDDVVAAMTKEINVFRATYGPEVVHGLYSGSTQLAANIFRVGAVSDTAQKLFGGSFTTIGELLGNPDEPWSGGIPAAPFFDDWRDAWTIHDGSALATP
jgi:hypothetical protein